MHRHFQARLAPGNATCGSKRFCRMISRASVGSTARPAQNRHRPPFRTVPSVGATSFWHTRHRDFHGKLNPGYVTCGSRFASRNTLTASALRQVRPAQYRHPLCPDKTLSRRGLTVSPHFKHWQSHGDFEPGYGTSGFKFAASIRSTASDSSTRTPEQYAQP